MRYTKRYVETALRAIAAEHPDNKNPVGDEGLCLYNGPDGTHCMIGQFLANEGVDVDEAYEGIGVHKVIADALPDGASVSFNAALVCERWQFAADGHRSWGDVAALMGSRPLPSA